MKLCIVGCGQVLEYHSGYLGFNKLESVHFVDTDMSKAAAFARQYAKKTQTYAFDDVTAVHGMPFDLVLVLTPNNSHYKVAKPFIEAGIPVFIEKPPALYQGDIFDMHKLTQQENPPWVSVGFQCRFTIGVRSIRQQLLETGDKIISIHAWKHRMRTPEYYNDGWHGTMLHDGGVLCQQGIHCVDLVCYLAGCAPEFVSMVGHNHKHKIECEDTADVTMRFRNFCATVNCTTAAGRGGTGGITVTTDHGVMTAEGFAFNQITQWDRSGAKPVLESREAAYDYMWDTIYTNCMTKAPPPVPLSSALPSMWVVHAAYTSASEDSAFVPYGRTFPKLGYGSAEAVR